MSMSRRLNVFTLRKKKKPTTYYFKLIVVALNVRHEK
jgi:hypothetical protein